MKQLRLSIILILFIVLTIIIILFILNKEQKEYNNQIEEDNQGVIYEELDAKILQNNSIFYSLGSIVQNYLNNLTMQEKEVLVNIIDPEYLKDNDLSAKNVLDNLQKLDELQLYIPRRIYEINRVDYVIYYIYGTIRVDDKTIDAKQNDFYIRINADYSTGAFTVTPIDDIEYKQAENNEIPLNEIVKRNITLNKYNELFYINIDPQTIIYNYLDDYKYNTINYLYETFDLLDEEYKEKRFGDIDKYKEYVSENIDLIKELNFIEYVMKKEENYTEYFCNDIYGNTYIFRETSPMQYTLFLDDYTIERPEYVEKYNSSNIQQKVALNINKFMKMINTNDYNNAYLLLNEEFRNKYFSTVEEFKQYIKNNFFTINKFDYVEYSEESNLSLYKVKITDAKQDGEREIEKTFIVKLLEGTQFELSFNVD